MNRQKFEFLLAECLDRLEEGESLQSILDTNPQQANRLKPLLKAAFVSRSLPKPEPSPEAVQSGKIRLLAEVDSLRLENKFSKNRTKSADARYTGRLLEKIHSFIEKENIDMKLVPRLAIYVLITALVGGFFSISASASSLPGDPLYGLKLGWEQAQMVFTFDNDAQAELEEEFETERLYELEELLEEGREEEIEFSGIIEEIGTSAWLISGITVQIDQDTELEGNLEVGTLVEVEALTQEDGSLLALEISAELDDDSGDDMDDDSDDDMDDGDDDDMDDESDDDMDDDSDDDMDDESDDESDDEESVDGSGDDESDDESEDEEDDESEDDEDES
jgi:hypothetical protein